MDWTAPRDWNGGLLALIQRTDGKIERLAELDFFDRCSRRALAQAARRVDFIPVQPGTVVVGEGTPARQVLIVARGKLRVLRPGTEEAVAGKGEVFGEMAALSHLPYSETLVAAGHAEVAVIGAREFLDLLEALPCLALKVLQRAVRPRQVA